MRYVYALRDPRTNEVCYIGQTRDTLWRYHQHLSRAKTQQPHIRAWVYELRALHLKPVMTILEEVDVEEMERDNKLAKSREQYWIRFYKSVHAPLLNKAHNSLFSGLRRTRPVEPVTP